MTSVQVAAERVPQSVEKKARSLQERRSLGLGPMASGGSEESQCLAELTGGDIVAWEV